KAYSLESTVAHVPRIVVSDTVADAVDEQLYRSREPYYNPALLLDSDGFWYINPFNAFGWRQGTFRKEAMIAVRGYIIEGLRNTSPDLLAKYRWLKRRFNATLACFHEEAPYDVAYIE